MGYLLETESVFFIFCVFSYYIPRVIPWQGVGKEANVNFPFLSQKVGMFTKCSSANVIELVYLLHYAVATEKRSDTMKDPNKRQYLYLTLSFFGAISLSILVFFLLYRFQGIGDVVSKLSDILAPFIYGSVVAYLLRPS